MVATSTVREPECCVEGYEGCFAENCAEATLRWRMEDLALHGGLWDAPVMPQPQFLNGCEPALLGNLRRSSPTAKLQMYGSEEQGMQRHHLQTNRLGEPAPRTAPVRRVPEVVPVRVRSG